jgi:hydrogenase nickel incorporation protein HypB
MEIKVVKDILGANDQIARENRQLFDRNKVFVVNVMASPGAGKTSVITETIRRLKGKVRVGVVEGDISSSLDAEAISKEDVPVVQINTGGECHLDASMTASALGDLPLKDIDLLLIENVGNLVCPAEFKIGEDIRILVSSTPEGDDKPFKYPLMFHEADAVLINKIDLLPYLKFDVDAFSKTINGINRRAAIFPVSCTTGQGIDEWVAWLLGRMGRK